MFSVEQASAPCDQIDSQYACSRTRRNSVVDDPEALHVVMKTLYCAHWRSIQNGGNTTTPEAYAENTWVCNTICCIHPSE